MYNLYVVCLLAHSHLVTQSVLYGMHACIPFIALILLFCYTSPATILYISQGIEENCIPRKYKFFQESWTQSLHENVVCFNN